MGSPHTGSLLASYYERFLRDHDLEKFQESVSARYNEGTLTRLVQSADVLSRRAAVLALGLNGSFEANADVARALADTDGTVRNLAENALWAIWFRADSAENNATLEEVRLLNNRGEYNAAILLATRLIGRSQQFAEAYNQRAIAHFMTGRFEQSAQDCLRVLELNPYHIGALAGLGRCHLQLDRPDDALATYERALKIQPYDAGLKQMVTALRSRDD